jgi:hypothetical protein
VAIVSTDVTPKETSSVFIKYSDRKISSAPTEKLREPMIKYKHLLICSGATLIISIVYTSDKRTAVAKKKIELAKNSKS